MTENRAQSVTGTLRALRGKLWLKRIIHHIAWGLLIGASLAVLELVAARALPVWYPWRWALVLIGAALVIGAVIGLLRRPGVEGAARFADRHGLEERMMTALCFRDDTSPMAVVQREEALARYHQEEERLLHRVSVWRVPRWMAGCFALCVLLGGLLWWLPNPMQQVVREQQKVKQALEKEEQKIAEKEEEMAKNDELTPEQKEDLQEQLQQLREELADSKDLQEGMEALAKAEAELDRLAEDAAKKQQALNGLEGQLASEAATKDLARALGAMDGEELREAMKDVRDALEQLTPEERDALAGKLAQAADDLAENKDLSNEELVEALRQAAENVRSGNAELAANALQNAVGQAIADGKSALAAANAATQTAQALSGSKQALAQAGTGKQTAQGDGTSNGQNGGSGNQPSNGSPGNGQGNGSGTQGGDGSGNGNGSGSVSGTGNGSGSGSGSGTGTGGSGTGSGSGAGLGSGSRELVSVPSARLKGGGPEETVGGPLGDGAETEQTRGTSIGSPGVSRPYSEVFGQYEQAARKALERSDLPPQYRQLVKDYFTDIKPSGKE